MALIPKGGANLSPPWQGTLRRGSVLVFDEGRREPNGCDAAPETPWAIFDPEAPATSPRWLDFYPIANRLPHPRYPPTPQYPNGKSTGNLACSHHTWTHDGRLALFGGNEKHSHQTGCIDGGYHVYLFDPTRGTIGNVSWVRQINSLLPTKRWYPSVVLTVVDESGVLRPRILVLGGNIDPLSTPSNYIAWTPPLLASTPLGSWEGGGTGVEIPGPSGQPLLTYPYAHLMSNGRVAVVRFREAQVATLFHNVNNTGTWLTLSDVVQARLRVREWGNSLLFPNLDADHRNAIVVLGGALVTDGPSTSDIQMCRPQRLSGCWPSGYFWTDLQQPTACAHQLQNLAVPRIGANAVLLPDGSFLVIGGGGLTGALETNAIERYDGSTWHACAPLREYEVNGLTFGQGGYGYHSTAILLPSGKVLIGAGNIVGAPRWEYQIYTPWYLACGGTRPKILAINNGVEELSYGQTFRITYELKPGLSIAKVVLMRPGSVSHGNNSDQRYIELDLTDSSEMPGEVWAKMPANPPGQGTTTSNPNEVTGPPGYYMLFLVTPGRIPSEAGWVNLRLP